MDDIWDQKSTRRNKKIIENFHFHQAFQKIHNFCANDLGGFYLDILKDRLYTAKTDSDARRSAQTALSNILQALLRWISPILSFTAEEAWLLMKEDEESVHLLEWFEDWHDFGELKISDDDWNKVLEIRSEANKHIEEAGIKKLLDLLLMQLRIKLQQRT